MPKDTKAVGDVTQAVVMAELLKLKICVLMPFGEGHRYDLVIHHNEKFLRIQCKTGQVVAKRLVFNTCSVVRDAKKKKWVKKYYTSRDIDLYGIYSPVLDNVYLVPVSVVRTHGSLGLDGSTCKLSAGMYELKNWKDG